MDATALPAKPIHVQQIDALLPQTQCTKCGFNGCLPYAQAISEGMAFNRCPPGGDATLEQLAQLLNQPVVPLDKSRGEAKAVVAFIREEECIGCTKCIQACPVDAIVGAAQLMHTVITNDCTGCELCIAPCPVDCIDLLAVSADYSAPSADQLRARYQQRQQRLQNFTAASKAPVVSAAATATVAASVANMLACDQDTLAEAHTAYAKAEKIYRDAEHAAKQACKRGRSMTEYQPKLTRLASQAADAKRRWEDLKSGQSLQVNH